MMHGETGNGGTSRAGTPLAGAEPTPRLLFLGINFSAWVCPTLYEEQKAVAARLPGSVFYGPGYEYETNLASEIVHRAFPSGGPDAVFCYVDERRLLGEPMADAICEHYELPPDLRVFPKGLASLRVPKFAWINDFWHCSRDEWDEILLGAGFDAAFSTYCPPFTSRVVFEEFFSRKVRERVRFIPWPRAINPHVFRDYGLPKIHDVSVLGAMSPSFYPLRCRMHEDLSRQDEWRYFSRPHPGYRFVSEPDALVGEAYAKVLNQSRVFGSCTGKFSLPFMKLYEVLACRTVLMCDTPNGAEHLGLRPDENFVAVDEDNYRQKLRAVLESPDRLDCLAAEGHRLVHERHTVAVRATEFAETVAAVIHGRSAEGWAALGPGEPGRAPRPSMRSHPATGNALDEEFDRYFTLTCVPGILDEARRQGISWQGRPLSWEVCHELLAYHAFSGARESLQALVERSNARYELLDRIWPTPPVTRDALDTFYRRSAEILPWGHGVFMADHHRADRRGTWLRRLRLLQWLRSQNVRSVLDYGAGGGHTSLLAFALGFDRVVHFEHEVFHPYVCWRARALKEANPLLGSFEALDASQPLRLASPVEAIVCTDVVEHVFDPDELLDHARNALVDGGWLMWVAMFEPGITSHLHCELRGHEEELLRRHGFERAGELPAAYSGHTGIYRKRPASARDGGVEQENTERVGLFTQEHEVYLASADRMEDVERNLALLERQASTFDAFASVVGGLSALNYLTFIRPKRLVFFDLNPEAPRYAALVFELVSLCRTPAEFVSRVFGRSVDDFLAATGYPTLNFANQARYLARPVEEALVGDTLERLSSEGRASWDRFLRPHLAGRTLDEVSNCRRLLPCWPVDKRVPVGGGEGTGTDDHGVRVANTNSWFYGHGWLASVREFGCVRNLLAAVPVQWQCMDLLQASADRFAAPGETALVHVSNIDDWFPREWAAAVQRLQVQAHASGSALSLLSARHGLIQMPADTHTWAYRAVAPHVTGRVVEVVHKTPWGFSEFERTCVTVSEYLAESHPADTTILHILLGERVDRATFVSVYRRALQQSRRIVVLEHDRESADWAPVPPAHYVTEAEMRRLLLENLCVPEARLVHDGHVVGERDSRRNFLMVVECDAPHPHAGAADEASS